jgi:hypothetical protein
MTGADMPARDIGRMLLCARGLAGGKRAGKFAIWFRGGAGRARACASDPAQTVAGDLSVSPQHEWQPEKQQETKQDWTGSPHTLSVPKLAWRRRMRRDVNGS